MYAFQAFFAQVAEVDALEVPVPSFFGSEESIHYKLLELGAKTKGFRFFARQT